MNPGPYARQGLQRVGITLALSFAWAGASSACPHPPGEAAYAIRTGTQGEIGRHVIRFTCADDDLVVETEIEGEVTVLTIPVFKRHGSYREVWRGDRLIDFHSRIVDNGEAYEVSARAAGERTIIEGRQGRIVAPATVVSNHPWNHAVVDRRLLFDTREGKLQNVQVQPAGTERLIVAGREIETRKYHITGDLERDLWYDEDGNWVQSRLEHRGDEITLTRQ